MLTRYYHLHPLELPPFDSRGLSWAQSLMTADPPDEDRRPYVIP